jgi:bis(5'-nucleosidyl)-tetraphosphatase
MGTFKAKINFKYRRGIILVIYSRFPEGIKYLVLKRKLHWKGWEFPKGGIEPGEKTRKAIIRETKEETGLNPIKIKKFNISGKYSYGKIYPDRPGFKGQDYTLYSAETKSQKIKIDRIEHSAYKWLDFKSAIKKLTWKNQKKCLKIVNNWLNYNK